MSRFKNQFLRKALVNTQYENSRVENKIEFDPNKYKSQILTSQRI